MGRVFFIFCLFFFLLFGLISSNEAVVDRVVAVVNQEIITLSELEKSVGLIQEEIQTKDRLERQERVHEVYRKVLEKLIEEKLIDQEVKRSGLKVTNKEIEGTVEEIIKRNGITPESFEKALAKEGFTLETYKKDIEKKLQRMKLINWAVRVESKAGDKELRDFFQKNIDRYQSNEFFRPGQILFLVPKETTPEEVRKIKKKCQEVLEKIKEGEDFGDMALLYSQDISSKDRGDLGYFKKGELLPVLERETLRLQVGEVGGIIRTDLGFHIIKLLDRKGGIPATFEEIKEKIRMDYYDEEMRKGIQQFLSTLKERSIIEIKL